MDNKIVANIKTTQTKNNANSIRRLVLIATCTILVFLVIWGAIIWVAQPSLFFQPWRDDGSHAKLLTEDGFEQITIDHNGNALNGWLKINTSEQKAPLIIFFGGNAQTSANTCIKFLYDNVYEYFEGYNFLMVDYPGYGLSEGHTSDQTILAASLATFDYACAMECVDESQIVLLGFSLGTCPATYVASQRDVNGLILVAPYDKALSLYNDAINIFYGPVKLLTRYKFNSEAYAKHVKIIPLIITSQSDQVIPCNFSLTLSSYFPTSAEVFILDYVGHNYYFDQSSTLRLIQNYLCDKLANNISTTSE